MACPEVKLVINLTISVIMPYEQFRLFEVGKGPKWEVGGSGVMV